MCDSDILKDLENLQLVPHHLKAQEMSKRAVKRFSYKFWYVPDQYKTQKMCESLGLKDTENLQFVPDHS